MGAGASVSAITAAMRTMSAKILAVAARSGWRARMRPVNGMVNVGGGHETPHITNLNPIKPGSGGPTSGIPNHVRASMEQMDEIFEPGSVLEIRGYKLLVDDFDWPRAAQAAANVMPPGGKLNMNVMEADEMADLIVEAFTKAGFKSVRVEDHGPGAMIRAVR
jgi:hypothetical protein